MAALTQIGTLSAIELEALRGLAREDDDLRKRRRNVFEAICESHGYFGMCTELTNIDLSTGSCTFTLTKPTSKNDVEAEKVISDEWTGDKNAKEEPLVVKYGD